MARAKKAGPGVKALKAGRMDAVREAEKLQADLAGMWASELEQTRTEWLVRPWIARGELHLVTGEPNAGKSTFGAYLMSKARRTVVLPGVEERFEGAALARMARHGVDPGRVLVLNDQEYRFPSHRERVLKVVRAIGADLLWIDPVDNYMEDISENDGQAVRAFLESFTSIAHATGCAVVGVRHPGKVRTNLLPGSRQWKAVPRMVIQLLYDPGPPERRIAKPDKDSLGREATARYYHLNGLPGEAPFFSWGKEVAEATMDTLTNVTDRVERWKVDQAEAFLKAFLATGKQESAAVYKAAEAERLNDRCVRRAAERLGVDIGREGTGKEHKSYWSLPKDTPATPDN